LTVSSPSPRSSSSPHETAAQALGVYEAWRRREGNHAAFDALFVTKLLASSLRDVMDKMGAWQQRPAGRAARPGRHAMRPSRRHRALAPTGPPIRAR